MTTLATPPDIRTPIDEYLARQQDLTAVERFADHHDRSTGPLHERWYRELLPAAPPSPGQQYRFEVDMDSCTSCKSCVAACHSLNGLDVGESWRSVGVVIGTGPSGPTQQTVTTACHHCVDPACLAGCPVDAYDKDPITGIVSHLDDQCIGCSYCTWTCPYEVPRFNERLGIVRKCDMCSDRLAVGEAPACVQACPTGAISIGIVDVAELVAGTGAGSALVPGAPASSLTVPTTRYHRRDELPPSATATDEWSEAPKHAHLPLVAMLVLTQLSAGTFAVLATLAALVDLPTTTSTIGAVSALAAGLVAIGASVGHLGRPLQAWRAVIGIGHSWLSREIVAFGLFAVLAVVAAVLRLAEPDGTVADGAGAVVSVVGIGAVGTSVMIYAVTGRRLWRLARTARAFATTTVTCGLSTATVVVVATTADADLLSGPVRVLAFGTAVVAASALVADAWLLRPAGTGDDVLDRSARLLRGPLAPAMRARLALTATGGVAFPLLLAALLGAPESYLPAARTVAVLGLALLVRGELCGRALFFRAMASPRMPGIPR